jgi:putative ABC transport system permease protein
MRALLAVVSWAEWRHHRWRHGLALLAVAIGVALAFAVHVINASALDEFGAAVRQVNGQPDVELRAAGRTGFAEAFFARVAAHPAVALASPVVEVDTYAFDARGQRFSLRVVGIDVLAAAPLAPALVPRPRDAADSRGALDDPDALYLNMQAAERLAAERIDRERGASAPATPRTVRLQAGEGAVTLPLRGDITAGGPPLAVMDIAGAQERFDRLGRLSRIDVRLHPGSDRAAVLRELALPADVRAAAADEAAQRLSNLSRAYRVNLTVLALVALFTGSFLVFSVLALSVAQRTPQLALLGVLGLAPRERLRLVLVEAALLGIAGSVLGLALGAALAWAALTWLAGDLGSGTFAGVTPALRIDPGSAAMYGALGTLAALAGAWLPSRMAQRLVPAQALKGLGGTWSENASRHGLAAWAAPLLLACGGLLALLPPLGGLPWGAYAAVAALLFGGIAAVPSAVAALLRGVTAPRRAPALVAVERARDERHVATVAVSGVVASLALAVALTVMVASFRDAVSRWLDHVLPADLYARTATRADAAQAVYLSAEVLAAAAAIPGVARIEGTRIVPLEWDASRPAVVLLARPLGDASRTLPLTGALHPRPDGEPANVPSVYVSEAVQVLYGAEPGTHVALPLPNGQRVRAFVQGVWRDYARQHGTVAMDRDAFVALTGDTRVNDLAVWLRDGAALPDVQQQLRELLQQRMPDVEGIEFATPREIRQASLRIFDRSFAVTTWLQAVAVGIGLAGVAASFSAQVWARRREFGLLAHLGFTRAQVLRAVAGEAAVWTAAGALLGTMLGLAVSVVLVHVVNPQSFHWTMDLLVPWLQMAALALGVVAAGTLTAVLAARRAASTEMALAVKDDW